MKKTIFAVVLLAACHVVFSRESRQPYQKGDVRLNLGLPHFNTFSFSVNNEFRDVEYGFNGYSIGLGYSYRDNRFMELSYAYVMTFEWFIPVPADAEYNKIMTSSYFNITDNLVLGSFTIGYGLHYSANTWREWTRNLDSTNYQPTHRRTFRNQNLGLNLNAWFRVGRTLHFGLIYQPSLLNLNDRLMLIYDHSISAGVLWRFKLLNIKTIKQRVRHI